MFEIVSEKFMKIVCVFGVANAFLHLRIANDIVSPLNFVVKWSTIKL